MLEMPLTCDRVRKENYAEAMTLVDARVLLSLLLLGIVGGAAHNMLILGSPNLFLMWKSSADIGISIGVWLVWLTMSSVVGSFVANAYRFAEIGGEYLEVDLLEPDGMQLIGRAALMTTLGLIGTQSFYPLLWIGGEAGLLEAFPGFFITTVWVAFLFYRSTVPIHRRIKAAKHKELKQIRMGISKARITSTGRPSQELISLLSYRTHVEKCSDWPFRIGIIFRWVFYILIPPLTWVGAALIENIVDALLT